MSFIVDRKGNKHQFDNVDQKYIDFLDLTDIVFQCRKCDHLLFLDNSEVISDALVGITKEDCPSCGEEGYGNWILLRQGNYKKEYRREPTKEEIMYERI